MLTFPRVFIANRTVLVATLVVVVCSLIGCGPTEPTDGEKVMFAISNLPDAARDAESFHEFFTEGAAPNESDRPHYSKYVFHIGETKVSGESATATVNITDTDGVSLGEQPWAFVLEDGEWKITSAPLP